MKKSTALKIDAFYKSELMQAIMKDVNLCEGICPNCGSYVMMAAIPSENIEVEPKVAISRSGYMILNAYREPFDQVVYKTKQEAFAAAERVRFSIGPEDVIKVEVKI